MHFTKFASTIACLRTQGRPFTNFGWRCSGGQR